jgi:lactate racemase
MWSSAKGMNHATNATAMANLDLPYGDGTLTLTMPEEWLGAVVQPPPVPVAADAAVAARQALQVPIGTLRLGALVRPGQRVAVIVDDYTRHTPLAQLLPPVLEELLVAGSRPDDIRLVIAGGSHRRMTAAEVEAKLGIDLGARFRAVQAPGAGEGDLVYLGIAPNGIPLYVDRAVVEAGLRVAVGNITPHLDAGWSGGAKMILPGVCGARTVDAFHAAGAFSEENQLGNPSAPLRLALEAIVAERVPLHFILNAVLTPAGEVSGCVAGHPVMAHRAGVALAWRAYGGRQRHRFLVVVAGCHPYDGDLWQSIKGAWCGDLLVQEGGTLVLVTRAAERTGKYPLVLEYARRARRDGDAVRRALAAGQVEDGKQAATGVMWSDLCRRVRVALVSAGLDRNDAEALGATYYETLDAAVADAVARVPAAERPECVAVIPEAGVTLPVIEPADGAHGP